MQPVIQVAYDNSDPVEDQIVGQSDADEVNRLSKSDPARVIRLFQLTQQEFGFAHISMGEGRTPEFPEISLYQP